MARPSKFTTKLGTNICKRIAEGESLRSVCRDKKMPNRSTVHDWLLQAEVLEIIEKKPELKEFSNQYEKSINLRTENMFDEIEDIADNTEQGVEKRTDAEGKVIETKEGDMLGHRRLRIDARKWYLSKVMPKKFGDRSVLTTEDDEGKTQPLMVQIIGKDNE